jgi:hypothetical protein
MAPYQDYVLGKNLTNRMPLYFSIGNNKKLSVKNINDYLGDHGEGTIFDSSSDVGAQAYNLSYRYCYVIIYIY